MLLSSWHNLTASITHRVTHWQEHRESWGPAQSHPAACLQAVILCRAPPPVPSAGTGISLEGGCHWYSECPHSVPVTLYQTLGLRVSPGFVPVTLYQTLGLPVSL